MGGNHKLEELQLSKIRLRIQEKIFQLLHLKENGILCFESNYNWSLSILFLSILTTKEWIQFIHGP